MFGAPLVHVANVLNNARTVTRWRHGPRSRAVPEVRITAPCPTSVSDLDVLHQVKSALTVVGLSDVAQYCKVKTISNPVRKALEKSSQLNQLSEASFTPTHYSKQSVAGDHSSAHEDGATNNNHRLLLISMPINCQVTPQRFPQLQQHRAFRMDRDSSFGFGNEYNKNKKTKASVGGSRLSFRAKDSKKSSDVEEHVKKLSAHEQLAYQYGLNVGKNVASKEHADADKGFSVKKIFQYAFILMCIYVAYRTISTMFTTDMSKGLGSFMNPSITVVNPEDVKVKFNDVKGCDEVKEELQDIVSFLKFPERFRAMGARLPSGVLLVGQPGIGKTMLAKAVAGEAGVPFFQMSGSEFDEIFVGTGSKKVRTLFAEAKKVSPSVIFIDEIDSVGAKRTSSTFHPYANQTVNQLLAEMDGFASGEGIIVIGATNKPDNLDKALLRPGRFDLTVNVMPPDKKGRQEILDHYLTKIKHKEIIDTDSLAKRTVGFSGADLENMINQAALKAVIDNAKTMTAKHIDWAKDKIQMGIEKKTNVPDYDTNLNTAYHEAGHTIVCYYTEDAMPIHKVTILQRGHALGVTSFTPEKMEYGQTRAQLLASLDVSMGGRVAEEIKFGKTKVTTGASSDFHQATITAENMVTHYGMSDLGVRVFYDSSQKSTNQDQISTEVNKLLTESYDRARDVLTKHRSELNLLAEALLEFETLDADDVKLLLTSRSMSALKSKKAKQALPPGKSPHAPGNVKNVAKPPIIDAKLPA